MSLLFLALVTSPPSPTSLGEAFVHLLAKGHSDWARAQFDANLAAKMGVAAVETFWKQLTTERGAFVRVERVDVESVKELRLENVVCGFAHGRAAIRVVFSPDGKVTGLFAKPADEARARQILTLFDAHKFAEVEALLSPEAKKVLNHDQLVAAWEAVIKTTGAYHRVKTIREESTSLSATVEFAGGDRELAFVFDGEGRLHGIHLAEPLSAWKAPAYVAREKFEERTVEVGPHKLGGILDVPKGASKFPGVVLLFGSGPVDADETIGAIKPFRDLAEGLASRGIAVLRFEKRTHCGIKVRTVHDEYMEDADHAVALLSAVPGVTKVALIGHSMGATLAPRIALANPKISALGLLSGTTWPYAKAIVEQLVYQKEHGVPNLDGLLATMRAAAKQIDDPTLKPDEIVAGMGATGAYFLDLRGYSATESAARLTLPLFIGWGERDLKTIPADFAGWRPLAKRPGVTLKTYPRLHHLLAPIGDPEGHVDPAVIDDLAKWLGR